MGHKKTPKKSINNNSTHDGDDSSLDLTSTILSTLRGGGGGGGGGVDNTEKTTPKDKQKPSSSSSFSSSMNVTTLRKLVFLAKQQDESDVAVKKLFKETVKELESNGVVQLDSDGNVTLLMDAKSAKKGNKSKKDEKDDAEAKEEEEEDVDDDKKSSSKTEKETKKRKSLDEANNDSEEEEEEDDDNDEKGSHDDSDDQIENKKKRSKTSDSLGNKGDENDRVEKEEGGEDKTNNDNENNNNNQTENQSNDKNRNQPCRGNRSGYTRLFLGNLPFSINETSLCAFLKPAGQVTHLRWITDANSGRFYGSAFVEMANSHGAAHAVTELNGLELMGRPIKINYAPAKKGDVWPPQKRVIIGSGRGARRDAAAGGKGVAAMRPKPENCAKLFIGNLPFSIDDDKLSKFFASVDAEVKAVRLLHHRDSGDFKGCGYVEFWNTEACEKAAALNGKNLLGRPIRIDWTD